MVLPGLGVDPAWVAEIDQNASVVLASHLYESKTPNLRDALSVEGLISSEQEPDPDLVVGGTPCQGMSLAGLRQSLKDPRTQVMYAIPNILNAIDRRRHVTSTKNRERSAWAIWENVAGSLTTTDNAFGHLLSAIIGAAEAVSPGAKRWPRAGVAAGPARAAAWRAFDATEVGSVQRRNRVWLVAGPDANACARALCLPDLRRRDLAATVPRDGEIVGAEESDLHGVYGHFAGRAHTAGDDCGGRSRGRGAPPHGSDASVAQATQVSHVAPAEDDAAALDHGDVAERAQQHGRSGRGQRYPVSGSAVWIGDGKFVDIGVDVIPTLKKSGRPFVANLDPSIIPDGARYKCYCWPRTMSGDECDAAMDWPRGWTGVVAETRRRQIAGNGWSRLAFQWVAERVVAEMRKFRAHARLVQAVEFGREREAEVDAALRALGLPCEPTA